MSFLKTQFSLIHIKVSRKQQLTNVVNYSKILNPECTPTSCYEIIRIHENLNKEESQKPNQFIYIHMFRQCLERWRFLYRWNCRSNIWIDWYKIVLWSWAVLEYFESCFTLAAHPLWVWKTKYICKKNKKLILIMLKSCHCRARFAGYLLNRLYIQLYFFTYLPINDYWSHYKQQSQHPW
jgi:hypothetical protein